MTSPLLEVDDLTVQYETADRNVTAVSSASFTVFNSEHFGLLGESGCGKSTLAKSLIGGLDDNGRITAGSVKFRGKELSSLSESDFNKDIRWKEISFIPQASMNILDPLRRISTQAREIARAHGYDEENSLNRFCTLLEQMGIPPERVDDYPHQFSGGMQQRAIISLSLFLNPSLIIADEPTTALDVVMQDQIINHLYDIKEDKDISIMLISHDVGLVYEFCDRLATMHGGQIVETGTPRELYHSPRHPYSIMLQRSIPSIRHPNQELYTIEGKPPQMTGEVSRCSFVDRCPWAGEECMKSEPPLELVETNKSENRQGVACFKHNDIYESDDLEGMMSQVVSDNDY